MSIHIYDAAANLSKEEVQELTGFLHRDAQCIELKKMGIPFFERRDGRPIVPRQYEINGEEHTVAAPAIDMDEFEQRVKA